MRNGESWKKCPEGYYCTYSHCTFEKLYHPEKFKAAECRALLKLGPRRGCNRGDLCAFFHNVDEKQQAENEALEFYDPLVDYPEEEEEEEDYEEEEEKDKEIVKE